MLRLDQKQFAALTHVSIGMVRRMERTIGPITAANGLLEAVRVALDDAGVELIEAGPYDGVGGPGLRFRGEPLFNEDVIDFEQAVEQIEIQEHIVPEVS